MATVGITQESSSPRIKQLRRLMYVLTALALIQALIACKIFYLGLHWRSLSLEILKVLVVFGVVALNMGIRLGREEGAYANLMSLKVCVAALLISVLTDMAVLQRR
jgi:hypothetical protein